MVLNHEQLERRPTAAMTSLERCMTVIRGGMPDRVPVCLHNFLMAAREAGIPLEKYLTEPEAAARAHLHAVEKYGYDCILIDLDTTMLAEAMGARRDCTPGEPGHLAAPAINSLDEVGKLKPADPARDGRIPVLVEAVRIMAREVGDRVAIRGNADQGAFSLAALLRGMQDFFMDLASEPDHPGIPQLLEVAYQTHIATHRALKAAGAHFTSLGDGIAGPDMVSPAMFRRFARPYQERLVRELGCRRHFRDASHLRQHHGDSRSVCGIPVLRFRTGLQDRCAPREGDGRRQPCAVWQRGPQRRARARDARAGARDDAAVDRDVETRRQVRPERRLCDSGHDAIGEHRGIHSDRA